VLGRPPSVPGEHTDEALEELGFSAAEVDDLRRRQVIASADVDR
jgi:crotonobetainyl-CoA:carnitine CoA-transferase CaiB-like acyl-CoA transferase